MKIKDSGDGAKASRILNFIVISFSMVFDENFSQSHLNQNVLAIVNCDENYTNLEKTLGPVLEEINMLHDKGTISNQGGHFALDFFVGGDMKLLCMV